VLLLRGASPAEAARLAEELKRHEEARKEILAAIPRDFIDGDIRIRAGTGHIHMTGH